MSQTILEPPSASVRITKDTFCVQNVLAELPKEVFEANNSAAFLRVLCSLVLWISCGVLLLISPWYLLPFVWLYASTVLTGIYAIAHDCGHNSFFSNSKLNSFFGFLCFLPFFYPLKAWKLHHESKHKDETSERKLKAQVSKSFFRLVNPFFWPYDIASLVLLYFDLSQFKPESQNAARLNIYLTYLTMAIFFPVMILNFGVWALVKFWLVPWLLFHFWKNSLRQALPSVILSFPKKQNYFRSQWIKQTEEEAVLKNQILTELTHYNYPKWFEIICHDINFQIPHYLSTNIPCYKLRAAHNILLNSKWSDKISTYNFGFSMLNKKKDQKKIITPPKSKVSTERTLKEKTLFQQINWLHLPLFVFTHSMAIAAFIFVDLDKRTFIWSVIWYYCTGLGITAGYHRLWAHRAYDASYPIRALLLFFGSGAVEGSARWWCRDHRVHHRYTDTDQDPYNARRGFWYSHMGWMLWKEDWRKNGRMQIEDLEADPMIKFQHKFYIPIAIFASFIFPTLVAGLLWGDYTGGYFYAGIVRLVFVHHATFFVNSLAHYVGESTFADNHTPRDSFITAILTLGEGYHNFHHEFPKDYRNAIKFYQYDPTKWVIRGLAFFGLTYNLHKFPENEVKKGRLQMQLKSLQARESSIDWGIEVESLPEYSWDVIKENKNWMVVGNIVHDISQWRDKHPGGPGLIDAFRAKDATNAFNGGVYNHSNAGRNLLTQLRIGRVEEQHHHEALDESQYEIEYSYSESDDSISTKKDI